MVAPPSTQGAAFQPSLLRPGEGGRPPVPRGTGAGPSLPGLRSRAVVVPSPLHNDHAAIVAGARHVLVSRTVLVESVCRQGGTHQGQCRRDAARRVWLRSAAGTRRRGLTFEKSGMALPATFSTRAHRRACGGRAAAARLLRHSATTCGLDLAHAPLLANTHPFDCHCP